MQITAELIARGARCPVERVRAATPFFIEVCARFQINTPKRLAAFLAQVAHESGRFRFVREVWGPTAAQLRYPGGRRWSGRGYIQLTHEFNYAAFNDEAKRYWADAPNFLRNPEKVEETQWAVRSAAIFWDKLNSTGRSLNVLADRGAFDKITRIINGGYNGLQDRRNLWASYTRLFVGEGVVVPTDRTRIADNPIPTPNTPTPGSSVNGAGPAVPGNSVPAPGATPQDERLEEYEGPAAVGNWFGRSRNVWAGIVAGVSALGAMMDQVMITLSSVEGLLQLLGTLATKPVFWLTLAGIVAAVAIIYLRYKRHKSGLPE